MDNLFLEIVTPEGEILSNNVKYVQVPATEGELGILPGHASLITLLRAGVIEIINMDGKKDLIAVENGGYIKIDEKKTTILVQNAVYIGGNSESEIANSLQKAKKLIEDIKADTSTYASTIAKIDEQARMK